MKKNTKILLLVAGFLALAAIACASSNPLAGVPLQETGKVYGFWNGIWDGFTALFALIANLFGWSYNIYQVHNNGFWYNFGFMLGVGAFAGGGGAASRGS